MTNFHHSNQQLSIKNHLKQKFCIPSLKVQIKLNRSNFSVEKVSRSLHYNHSSIMKSFRPSQKHFSKQVNNSIFQLLEQHSKTQPSQNSIMLPLLNKSETIESNIYSRLKDKSVLHPKRNIPTILKYNQQYEKRKIKEDQRIFASDLKEQNIALAAIQKPRKQKQKKPLHSIKDAIGPWQIHLAVTNSMDIFRKKSIYKK